MATILRCPHFLKQIKSGSVPQI
ncbi:MAG: hypothetical protein H6Q69_5014, partial [Firmicutes bacterium]|nr:hypothetical protein [Bacillota bacterium]